MNPSGLRTTTDTRLLLERARADLMASAAAGTAGRAAIDQYSLQVDGVIQDIFAAAGSLTPTPAIVALGGYGRRHLCLHSDIDLLILFEQPIGPDEERFVSAMLTPLWDLKLVLGHQVRELADFQTLEADNPEYLLALLDARFVAGDALLAARALALFHQPAAHAHILASLRDLIAERHAQFNDTLYQLEPDVKDAPGALRDLMAFRTIPRLTDPALVAQAPVDPAHLEEAEDFLFRVRSAVHLEVGRNQNILTHELQEKTAQRFWYAGAQPQQRVERLMGDYFRHARVVSRALEWVRRTALVPVGVNLVRSRDGIRFVDEAAAGAAPETWLSLFQAALDNDAPVADESLAIVKQHAEACAPEDLLPSAAHQAAFLHFLNPRPGLYARLSEMHDCGLLGRLLPEFRAISSRVVRDFYHKYTVDEHTLLTIRNLERLRTPATPSRARFGSLLNDLEAPELVVLSLLYHDVGKWRDDDHHLESVRMAQAMMDRLQLPGAARETIDFLIRHHIAMSLVAFRRDTEDPEIVERFASFVGIEERLKMLCLITLVDVEAVSLEILTPWREELLWRLYVDTYNYLTLKYGDDLIAQDQTAVNELLAGRPAGVSESEIRRFVEGLPRKYLQLFSHEAIYGHVQLSRNITSDHVHATLDEKNGSWELTVVTLDKPFLFSNICGVLSSFGMDILRGHAFTNPNGLVLDSFQFTDQERFLALNPKSRTQFLAVLSDAVSGRSDVSDRLRARERGAFRRKGVPRVEPTIHCDNQSSRRYTILDIIATNAIGLLHRISRVMSRHGCDVDLVLISTEGQKAIDVFHITQAGAKLSDGAQRALTDDLHRMLEETDEAD